MTHESLGFTFGKHWLLALSWKIGENSSANGDLHLIIVEKCSSENQVPIFSSGAHLDTGKPVGLLMDWALKKVSLIIWASAMWAPFLIGDHAPYSTD